MYFEKDKLIKSPMNYTGGKYKLLPQMLPLFPDNINNFYDLFCGGGNVAINVQANKIACFDQQKEVIDFLQTCSNRKSQIMVKSIKAIIKKYGLSKINRKGFFKLRSDYNNGNNNWDMFYTLICYAFNNYIRFNSKGEYNYSFGENKSSFNPTLEKNFIAFVDHMKTKNFEFNTMDFRDFDINSLLVNDFVYADPPYLITTASYNSTWTEKEELELYKLLDSLNEKKIKFALSNVIQHKDKTNDLLKEWSKKYIVHQLNYSYSNCNYQTQGSSQEVLIINYKQENLNLKTS